MKEKSIDEIFLEGDIEKVNETNLNKETEIEYKKLERQYEIEVPYNWFERITKKLINYFSVPPIINEGWQFL